MEIKKIHPTVRIVQAMLRSSDCLVFDSRTMGVDCGSHGTGFKVVIGNDTPDYENSEEGIDVVLHADDDYVKDSAKLLGDIYQRGFTVVIFPHDK
ncbi:MAG: hypothetical protein ACWGQW_05060 [bacterium]